MGTRPVSAGGKPWEKYGGAAPAKAKPWERYGAPAIAPGTQSSLSAVQDQVGGMFPARPEVPSPMPAFSGPNTAGPVSSPGYGDPLGMLRDATVGTATAVGQGASLGWGDDIAGTIIPGADVAIRREQEKFRTLNPAAAATGEIGGAIGGVGYALPTAMAAPLGFGMRLARGTTLGAGIGAVQGAGATDGDIQARISGAGDGAIIGGLAGGAFEAGAPILRRMISGPTQAPPPAIRATADSLLVPVPMTAGQATDDVGLLMRERSLARGAEGGTAANIMRDAGRRSEDALIANQDALRAMVARGAPIIERNEGGRMVSDRLATMRREADANARGLYDEAERLTPPTPLQNRPFGDPETAVVARNEGANMRRPAARRLAVTLWDDTIREIPLPENAPQTFAAITRFGRLADADTVPIADVYQIRKILSTLQRSGGAEASAATIAKRTLDRGIDDMLERQMLSGDEQAIEAWRSAIGNYRDYAAAWKGKDFVAKLTESNRGQGGALTVKPEDAANYIFGAGKIGVSKRDMTYNLLRLRQRLGNDSAEWNALRQEMFMRIGAAARGQTTPGGTAFSGAKLHQEWTRPENQAAIRVLYSEGERRAIGNWVEVARRVTVKDPAVYAPSASPFDMRRVIGMGSRIAEKVPVIGPYLTGLREFAQDAAGAAAARRATSGRLPVPAALRAAPGTPAALLAAPVPTADYQRSGRQ